MIVEKGAVVRIGRAFAAAVLTRACGWFRQAVPCVGSRVLMYHAIGSRIPSDVQGRYSLPSERFYEHMQCLGASGYPIVPFGASGAEATVAVTFDDGYRDNYHTAYPILADLNIPFTIFVTADFVRVGAPLYLQPEELRALASNPLVTIGAHGSSHIPFSHLDSQVLRHELADSRQALEDIIGRSVDTMSYPHGAVNERIRGLVEEAGFRLAACSRFGCNTLTADPLQLNRTDIWSSDSVRDFERKLAGAWDWLGLVGARHEDEPERRDARST